MSGGQLHAWTTGGEAGLSHKRKIDSGGSGAVHEVTAFPAKLTECHSFMIANENWFILTKRITNRTNRLLLGSFSMFLTVIAWMWRTKS
jgi:hypothetical protein